MRRYWRHEAYLWAIASVIVLLSGAMLALAPEPRVFISTQYVIYDKTGKLTYYTVICVDGRVKLKGVYMADYNLDGEPETSPVRDPVVEGMLGLYSLDPISLTPRTADVRMGTINVIDYSQWPSGLPSWGGEPVDGVILHGRVCSYRVPAEYPSRPSAKLS